VPREPREPVKPTMTSPARDFVVRRCTMRDLSGVHTVLKASWHSAYDSILGPQRATEVGRRYYSKLNLWMFAACSISRSDTLLLVATRGQATVGYAVAQRDDASAEIVLYMLYVHPECKALGIGSALVDAVIAHFPAAKAIRLEVLRDNTGAIRWYKSKGFEIYGETEHATATPNVAAVYMDKKIDRSV
jgi:ribosomal protein S18 acetylase RimI-like enzyme